MLARKRGRPAQSPHPYRMVAVNMRADLKAAVRAAARDAKMPLSAWVRECIQAKLRQDKESRNPKP